MKVLTRRVESLGHESLAAVVRLKLDEYSLWVAEIHASPSLRPST
jgi:hypothetical protein